MELDRSGVVPLYRQIANHFLDAIESKQIVPGHQLGNEIELARKFGVSRPTMRQAIQTLVTSGLLVRKPGIGTTVLPGVITRPVRLTSLADDLRKDGQQPVTTVLLNRVIPAPAHVSEVWSVNKVVPLRLKCIDCESPMPPVKYLATAFS